MSGSGWNRPSETSEGTREKHVGRQPSISRGLLGGAIVVTLVVVAYFFFTGDTQPSEEISGTKDSRIKDAVPSAAPTNDTHQKTNATKVVDEKTIELTEEQRLLQGRDTNKWIVVTNPHTGKKFISRYICPGNSLPPPMYKNGALNVIDALMFADTSDPMFGVQINKTFMDELQQAMIDHVELSDDDTPEIRERKQAMIDLLADFKTRLKDGEDLAETIQDTLRERRNINAFKEMIIQTRMEMRESGASDEEVADFEQICNEKLKEKGASPILTRESLIQAAERRRLSKEVNQ